MDRSVSATADRGVRSRARDRLRRAGRSGLALGHAFAGAADDAAAERAAARQSVPAPASTRVTWAGGQRGLARRSGSRITARCADDCCCGRALCNTHDLRRLRRRRPDAARLRAGAAVQPGDPRPRAATATIFILPILIPGIVVGAIWKLMLNFDFGLVNQIDRPCSASSRVNWLGAKSTALASVIARRYLALDAVLLPAVARRPGIAAAGPLRGGANRRRHARGRNCVYVTLPMMVPTIVVTFAFRLVLAFKVFDEVYLLTGGGPGTATEVLSFTLYQRFFTRGPSRLRRRDVDRRSSSWCCILLVFALSARRRSGTAP